MSPGGCVAAWLLASACFAVLHWAFDLLLSKDNCADVWHHYLEHRHAPFSKRNPLPWCSNFHELRSNGIAILQAIHHIADNHYYGVIKEYVGHGVGRRFHSAPTINHTRNNLPGNMQLWQKHEGSRSECIRDGPARLAPSLKKLCVEVTGTCM
eukprot:scaffold21609_cov19-Tisochrysis_lutea.AAC.2